MVAIKLVRGVIRSDAKPCTSYPSGVVKWQLKPGSNPKDEEEDE